MTLFPRPTRLKAPCNTARPPAPSRLTPGSSYYNLVVNANTLTFTLAANLVVAGSVTIQAGTTLDVTAANYSLTVGGNWTNSGTFTPRNGTVAFNPAQTAVLTGSTTFYNLSCTTPGKTLQFAAGSTQTIATGGIFTIAGANGTNILLRSTAASAYTIALTGTATANVTLLMSSILRRHPGITATDSVNSGNNTGWTFTGTSYTWNGTTDVLDHRDELDSERHSRRKRLGCHSIRKKRLSAPYGKSHPPDLDHPIRRNAGHRLERGYRQRDFRQPGHPPPQPDGESHFQPYNR